MGIEDLVKIEIIRPIVAMEFRNGRNPLPHLLNGVEVRGERVHSQANLGGYPKPVVLCLDTGKVAVVVDDKHEFHRIPREYIVRLIEDLGAYGFLQAMPCYNSEEVERFFSSR